MHIELLDISSSVFDIPGNAFTIRRTMAIIDNSNLVRYKFVLAGDIISINVSLIALCLICVFFWQRWQLAQAKNHTIATSLLLFVSRAQEAVYSSRLTMTPELRYFFPLHSGSDCVTSRQR